jgi:glutamate carboxypeptidase
MVLPISDFSPRIGEMIELLKELVDIESPTNEKAAVVRAGEWVSRQLSGLGAQVTIEPQRDVRNHVIGRWGVDLNPKERILLLFHMDTVHQVGSLLTNPCQEREGKLFGPGVQDMKSGIVLFLIAAKVLQEKGIWPTRPVTALFTSMKRQAAKPPEL